MVLKIFERKIWPQPAFSSFSSPHLFILLFHLHKWNYLYKSTYIFTLCLYRICISNLKFEIWNLKFSLTYRSSLGPFTPYSVATPQATPCSRRKVISFPWCRAWPPSEWADVSPLPWVLLGWPFITFQDVVSTIDKREGDSSKSSQSLTLISSPKALSKSPSSGFLSLRNYLQAIKYHPCSFPQDGPQNRSSHETSLTAPVGRDFDLDLLSSTIHLLIIVS